MEANVPIKKIKKKIGFQKMDIAQEIPGLDTNNPIPLSGSWDITKKNKIIGDDDDNIEEEEKFVMEDPSFLEEAVKSNPEKINTKINIENFDMFYETQKQTDTVAIPQDAINLIKGESEKTVIFKKPKVDSKKQKNVSEFDMMIKFLRTRIKELGINKTFDESTNLKIFEYAEKLKLLARTNNLKSLNIHYNQDIPDEFLYIIMRSFFFSKPYNLEYSFINSLTGDIDVSFNDINAINVLFSSMHSKLGLDEYLGDYLYTNEYFIPNFISEEGSNTFIDKEIDFYSFYLNEFFITNYDIDLKFHRDMVIPLYIPIDTDLTSLHEILYFSDNVYTLNPLQKDKPYFEIFPKYFNLLQEIGIDDNYLIKIVEMDFELKLDPKLSIFKDKFIKLIEYNIITYGVQSFFTSMHISDNNTGSLDFMEKYAHFWGNTNNILQNSFLKSDNNGQINLIISSILFGKQEIIRFNGKENKQYLSKIIYFCRMLNTLMQLYYNTGFLKLIKSFENIQIGATNAYVTYLIKDINELTVNDLMEENSNIGEISKRPEISYQKDAIYKKIDTYAFYSNPNFEKYAIFNFIGNYLTYFGHFYFLYAIQLYIRDQLYHLLLNLIGITNNKKKIQRLFPYHRIEHFESLFKMVLISLDTYAKQHLPFKNLTSNFLPILQKEINSDETYSFFLYMTDLFISFIENIQNTLLQTNISNYHDMTLNTAKFYASKKGLELVDNEIPNFNLDLLFTNIDKKTYNKVFDLSNFNIPLIKFYAKIEQKQSPFLILINNLLDSINEYYLPIIDYLKSQFNTQTLAYPDIESFTIIFYKFKELINESEKQIMPNIMQYILTLMFTYFFSFSIENNTLINVIEYFLSDSLASSNIKNFTLTDIFLSNQAKENFLLNLFQFLKTGERKISDQLLKEYVNFFTALHKTFKKKPYKLSDLLKNYSEISNINTNKQFTLKSINSLIPELIQIDYQTLISGEDINLPNLNYMTSKQMFSENYLPRFLNDELPLLTINANINQLTTNYTLSQYIGNLLVVKEKGNLFNPLSLPIQITFLNSSSNLFYEDIYTKFITNSTSRFNHLLEHKQYFIAPGLLIENKSTLIRDDLEFYNLVFYLQKNNLFFKAFSTFLKNHLKTLQLRSVLYALLYTNTNPAFSTIIQELPKNNKLKDFYNLPTDKKTQIAFNKLKKTELYFFCYSLCLKLTESELKYYIEYALRNIGLQSDLDTFIFNNYTFLFSNTKYIYTALEKYQIKFISQEASKYININIDDTGKKKKKASIIPPSIENIINERNSKINTALANLDKFNPNESSYALNLEVVLEAIVTNYADLIMKGDTKLYSKKTTTQEAIYLILLIFNANSSYDDIYSDYPFQINIESIDESVFYINNIEQFLPKKNLEKVEIKQSDFIKQHDLQEENIQPKQIAKIKKHKKPKNIINELNPKNEEINIIQPELLVANDIVMEPIDQKFVDVKEIISNIKEHINNENANIQIDNFTANIESLFFTYELAENNRGFFEKNIIDLLMYADAISKELSRLNKETNLNTIFNLQLLLSDTIKIFIELRTYIDKVEFDKDNDIQLKNDLTQTVNKYNFVLRLIKLLQIIKNEQINDLMQYASINSDINTYFLTNKLDTIPIKQVINEIQDQSMQEINNANEFINEVTKYQERSEEKPKSLIDLPEVEQDNTLQFNNQFNFRGIEIGEQFNNIPFEFDTNQQNIFSNTNNYDQYYQTNNNLVYPQNNDNVQFAAEQAVINRDVDMFTNVISQNLFNENINTNIENYQPVITNNLTEQNVYKVNLKPEINQIYSKDDQFLNNVYKQAKKEQEKHKVFNKPIFAVTRDAQLEVNKDIIDTEKNKPVEKPIIKKKIIFKTIKDQSDKQNPLLENINISEQLPTNNLKTIVQPDVKQTNIISQIIKPAIDNKTTILTNPLKPPEIIQPTIPPKPIIQPVIPIAPPIAPPIQIPIPQPGMINASGSLLDEFISLYNKQLPGSGNIDNITQQLINNPKYIDFTQFTNLPFDSNTDFIAFLAINLPNKQTIFLNSQQIQNFYNIIYPTLPTNTTISDILQLFLSLEFTIVSNPQNYIQNELKYNLYHSDLLNKLLNFTRANHDNNTEEIKLICYLMANLVYFLFKNIAIVQYGNKDILDINIGYSTIFTNYIFKLLPFRYTEFSIMIDLSLYSVGPANLLVVDLRSPDINNLIKITLNQHGLKSGKLKQLPLNFTNIKIDNIIGLYDLIEIVFNINIIDFNI